MRHGRGRMAAAIMAGALGLSSAQAGAAPVTQKFLDTQCRKMSVQLVENNGQPGIGLARVFIAYACSNPNQIEYESLHYQCPGRGLRTLAAAVLDIGDKLILTDREERGNFRTAISADEIPMPLCDLPL